MLKHRFLDAVINMNFDELLDQSLDDEVGAGEYRRLVTSRDCHQVETDVNASDYLPLYVKMHGTASEPESLRYTSESYYDLPPALLAVAEELLRTPRCIVLNVGFGMAGFDFHQLLSYPREVEIYDLSMKPVAPAIRGQINEQRRVAAMAGERPIWGQVGGARFLEEGTKSELALLLEDTDLSAIDVSGSVAAELDAIPDKNLGLGQALQSVNVEKAVRRRIDDDETPPHRITYRHVPSPKDDASDTKRNPSEEAVLRLVTRVDELLKKTGPAEARSIMRHLTLDKVLGPQSIAGERLVKEIGLTANGLNPRGPGSEVYAGYLRRRTILELAFASVKANGLVSIANLAIDRPGRYYDIYRSEESGGQPFSWQQLCAIAGLEETQSVPDLLFANDNVSRIVDSELIPNPKPHESIRTFADHLPTYVETIVDEIVDEPTVADRRALVDGLAKMHGGTEIELHSRDDRVCAKTFRAPTVLKTRTALRAYSTAMLRNVQEGDHVQAIAESGGWLCDETNTEALQRAKRISLVIAFAAEDASTLYERFADRLRLRIQSPWRHNRHLTVIKRVPPDRAYREDESDPIAIYFARHRRTAYITPVALTNREDIARVQRLFDNQWKEAKPLRPS